MGDLKNHSCTWGVFSNLGHLLGALSGAALKFQDAEGVTVALAHPASIRIICVCIGPKN